MSLFNTAENFRKEKQFTMENFNRKKYYTERIPRYKKIEGLTKFSESMLNGFNKGLNCLNSYYMEEEIDEAKKKEKKALDIVKQIKELEKKTRSKIWTEKKSKYGKFFLFNFFFKALYDNIEKRIPLEPYQVIKGSVYCKNKFLPLEFAIFGSEVRTEVMIRFNKLPNHNDFDIVYYQSKFIIPESHQSKLTQDFSIKFMVLSTSEESNAFFRVKFLGEKPRRNVKSMKKFEKIDYQSYLNFELRLSAHQRQNIENGKMKNLPIVKRNKEMAYVCKTNYRKLKSQKRSQIYNMKKELFKSRKRILYLDQKRKKKERMNKFLKIKIRVNFFFLKFFKNQMIIKTLLEKGVKMAQWRIWIFLIKSLSILKNTSDEFWVIYYFLMKKNNFFRMKKKGGLIFTSGKKMRDLLQFISRLNWRKEEREQFLDTT